jgi:thioredoxin 1
MANANVMTFTTETWEKEVLQSDKPVLVDFWAVWCGPCKQLSPTIDKLADQFAGKVKIGKLNTDENQDVAVRYGISSIPTILLFKGGNQVGKSVGVRPEAEFVKLLNQMLES